MVTVTNDWWYVEHPEVFAGLARSDRHAVADPVPGRARHGGQQFPVDEAELAVPGEQVLGQVTQAIHILPGTGPC